MTHLVIMAGGTGGRLWPMSTPEKPKQFVDVLGIGRTLIQLTVDRFKNICAPQQIWVVTSQDYVDWVRQQLPEIPEDQILMEPCMRNTAPCIAYAAWKIKERDAMANLIISPADHFVMDTKSFTSTINKGLMFTESSDRILTIGIEPVRAEAGYGYLRTKGGLISDFFFKVESFKEKPSKRVAEQYLRDKCYYWNSGIFIWNVATIEKAFRVYQPAMASIFDRIAGLFYTDQEQILIDAYYPQCENVSIDYGIMEHAGNIYIIPASLGWSDLGTWGSFYSFSGKDSFENVVIGDSVQLIYTENCLISVSPGKHCILEGLKDCIVVENEKALLICRKENEQDVKKWIR